MQGASDSRVRDLRVARGLSQAALADEVALSRQSVSAIESGRSTPSVDVALRFARALGASVEALFGEATEPTTVLAEASAVHVDRADPVDPFGGRVALARIGGRWVAHPIDGRGGAARASADGLAVPAPSSGASARASGVSAGGSADARAMPSPSSDVSVRAGRRGPLVEVALTRSLGDAADNVVLTGCAPALGVLADRLNRRPGPGRFLWLSASSTGALEALGRGHTHVAGVHLVDADTGESNVADVRRLLDGGEAVALIALARWEAGIVTAAGNPQRLRGAADLARRDLRLAAREPGSGARRRLDAALEAAGATLAEGAMVAAGHLEVAHAVALGAADAGVATRDAAIAFGLGFVPLAEERYDLVVPLANLTDPRVARLLDVMTSASARRELAALGYDLGPCGDRVADVHAA